ncbi:diguanylate cyclase/phosphodiesterase (GGDEF & EAL domains) with PAS/PAC sensor(s) [Indibacter alkaliphilus LW1]|uniref:histidine kinase n=1 Tax=Indibacter alkaliphilus (strain CCUG 57479 / KCTC 22604 / LW1) TaxID=1189612 RepID=S2DIA9_INDAL|nr:PAS domain S-box protein [Indibacter alkaliphilus]EOZ98759.1 diguanylate cyclase/phosphodiesterase (GGDEF & EAL domains) with PAS/PAC sensor(s) [Indibacter alkaliphilus LW1]
MEKKLPDYSSLFYLNPLPSWVYDLETYQILDVNQAAIDHYGYSKDEFLGLTIKDLRPKEEIQKMVMAHEGIDEKEGSIFFGVFTHQKKNAELIRMEINGHKIGFQGKECMLIVCQDVSEQEDQLRKLKESEEALRKSEAKFKTIFDIASLGIAQVDPSNGKIILVNAFYETITGYSTEELLNMSFVDLTHPDDRGKDWEIFSKAVRGESQYRNEKRYIKKDGSTVWVRLHLAFIRDEQGKPIRTVAICEDITPQKNEEQRLKLLESVITNTSDSILITEAEPFELPGPKIIYVNEAFTKMTGYTAEEVIGKTPRILQGPNSDQEELSRLSRALRNWESCEITTINYKKNGEEFWINFSVSPVANEKGWFTHWVAIERDVTEQKNKELENQLLNQINEDFSFENNLMIASNELCQTVSEFGKFDFVELWLPNLENSQIQLFAHQASTSKAAVFYIESSDITSFHQGEGLPGIVWEKQTALLWKEINEHEDFIRKEAAEKAGITSALGIPLLCNEKIVGVLVIGTQHELSFLQKYVKIFQQLEQFIGSEINRKRLENDLEHLFDAIPDIICITDLQGKFLKINKAGCELLGYHEDEIINATFKKFLHPEDREISNQDLSRLKAGLNTSEFENRYITKSGEIIWLSWTSNSSLEEGLIYATARNISGEKKLRELNRLANTLAKIGSWEIDITRNKVYWSELVHELHETDPNTFIPDLETGINFYREDFKSLVKAKVNHCIETGLPFDFEAVLITAKRRERWVRSIGSAEFVDGQCVRVYGSFQDIHERKDAEVRLQSLADNLPGVVFQYLIYPDSTDTLKYVTKGSVEIWGFSPDEVLENNQLVWNQIREGGNFEDVSQSITESILSKSKWTASWKYVMPSGEVKTHLGYGSPYFLPDGSVSFNSVVLDITQEAKNEALLEQATGMAKIGSWELDLLNEDNDAMYWSPMTREILEVDDHYNPSLTGGFEFYEADSKGRIENAVDKLIKEGIEFDEELLIITNSGKEKWIRCIGKHERVKNKCVKIFGSFQDIHASKSLEIQIREILGSISDAFYALNSNWEFTYFNRESEKLLGKTESEVIGENIWEVFPNALGTALEESYYRVAASGQSESFEYLRRKDQNWYEISVYPFSGGISVFFRNIQERKISAEMLKKAYLEKNNIIESIADAFFTVDKNFIVSYWNKSAEDLLGVKRERLIGKRLWDVFPDAVSLPSYTNYNKVLETGKPISFEDYYGIWLEVNAYPSEEGLTVFFRDITLRKEADQRLMKAFEEKNKILERIGDAFFALDKDWNVTYWNKRAEEIIGIPREDLIGNNLWDKFPLAKELEFFKQYERAFQTQTPVNFEEFFQPLNQWYEASGYPSPEGISVFFRDVTEKK